MLVGYVIHNPVTQDSDNGCWWGQDGTAIFAWSLALQRHDLFKPLGALSVVAVVVSFEEN